MLTCPTCICVPCVCDADEPQPIAFTARALRAMLYALERSHRNTCGSSMGPHCDLARCQRDAIHQAHGGEPDHERAALYDAAPALLKACEAAALWLAERAAHYRSLGSHAVADGLTERANLLCLAVAKARRK